MMSARVEAWCVITLNYSVPISHTPDGCGATQHFSHTTQFCPELAVRPRWASCQGQPRCHVGHPWQGQTCEHQPARLASNRRAACSSRWVSSDFSAGHLPVSQAVRCVPSAPPKATQVRPKLPLATHWTLSQPIGCTQLNCKQQSGRVWLCSWLCSGTGSLPGAAQGRPGLRKAGRAIHFHSPLGSAAMHPRTSTLVGSPAELAGQWRPAACQRQPRCRLGCPWQTKLEHYSSPPSFQ